MMPISGKTTALAALLAALVCASANAQQRLRPVTDAMLENPDPADWLMWRRTQNHWAYSPLGQVDGGTSRSCAWSGLGRSLKACRKGRRSFTTA